jgi:hypothetical protein
MLRPAGQAQQADCRHISRLIGEARERQGDMLDRARALEHELMQRVAGEG